jgi:hypothetical protein
MPEQLPKSSSTTDFTLEREKIALEREMMTLERERMNAEREQWKTESDWQKKAAKGLHVGIPGLSVALLGALVIGIIAGYQTGFSKAETEINKPTYIRVSTPFLNLLERAPLAADTSPTPTTPQTTFDFFEGYRKIPDNIQRMNILIITR